MIVKDGKNKFCNFEGILRKKRWPIGVDALCSIPVSEHEAINSIFPKTGPASSSVT